MTHHDTHLEDHVQLNSSRDDTIIAITVTRTMMRHDTHLEDHVVELEEGERLLALEAQLRSLFVNDATAVMMRTMAMGRR